MKPELYLHINNKIYKAIIDSNQCADCPNCDLNNYTFSNDYYCDLCPETVICWKLQPEEMK